jgi:hypothetical protein
MSAAVIRVGGEEIDPRVFLQWSSQQKLSFLVSTVSRAALHWEGRT